VTVGGDRLPDRPGSDDPGRGRRLGIDFGSVRIGVAASDPDGILATPVETVRRDRSGGHLRRLVALIGDLDIVEVIAGRIHGIPVRLADERLTTVAAQRSLREAGIRAKAQRSVIDQAAAVAILQGWLDQRRTSAPYESVPYEEAGGD
jgi:putative Holliday junction resolvase